MKKILAWLLLLALAASTCFPISLADSSVDVLWEESFETKDSLSNWSVSGAALSLEEKAMKIKMANGVISVSSTKYPAPVLNAERMGLSFQLKADSPESIASVSLILTDDAGLTSTYELDTALLSSGRFITYNLPMHQATSTQEGYNENAVKMELRIVTTAICTAWLDSMSFSMYDDIYWSSWVYDYEAEKGEYSIAVLPDLQNTNVYFPDKMDDMMRWIVDNTEQENIQFTIDLGDITWNGYMGANDANAIAQFETSNRTFSILDEAGMDYSISYGNHDYTPGSPRSTALFNEYFPISRFSCMESFSGAMEEGKSDNTYYIFTANGVRYMIVALEFAPRKETFAWANEVIASHPECNVIVTTHGYIDGESNYITSSSGHGVTGQNIWDKLIKNHANIFMVLCGHETNDNDPGSMDFRQDVGDNGNTVYQYMVNSQDIDVQLGVTPLLMMRFSDGGNTIDFNYFSVNTGAAFKHANQFRITLPEGQLITPTESAEILIDTIPDTVTREDKDAVNAAFDAYHSLTEEQMALVGNADKLNDAWTALSGLMTDDELVQTVSDKIDALNAEKPNEGAVKAARAAYDTLTDTQKALVDNLDKLEAAEKALTVVYGDINTDGEVNAADALLALQHSVKLTILKDNAFTAADVDKNAVVDATDALYILQKSVKLISSFPAEN